MYSLKVFLFFCFLFLFFVFVFFIPNIFLKPLEEELKCNEHEFKTMDNECDCIDHFERKSGKCESIFGYCNQTFQCRNEKFKCSDKTKGYCKPNCGYETDKNCETGCQSTYEDECIPIVQCDDNLKCYGEQVCLKDDVYNGECRCPEGIPDKKYYCTHSITTTFESPLNDMPDYEDPTFKFLKYFLIVMLPIITVICLALCCIIYIIRLVKKNLRTQNQQNPENNGFLSPTHENRDINENTPQISESETNDETEC